MNWTSQSQPFGANRAPVITGWAADDSGAVPIAVDPITGRLLTSTTGSGSSTVSTVYNGQVTMDGSADQLPNHSLTQAVVVQALSTNGHSLFVGGTGVTTSTGIELTPGSAVTLPVSNTDLLWAVGTASDVITFVGG